VSFRYNTQSRMKNFELKAVAHDLGRLRRTLRALGAKRQRPLAQTDTYFSVPSGRLKLRQRKGGRTAELLVYLRPDARRARASEYQKLPVSDAPGLLKLFRGMFTEDVCVRKTRDLWMLGETRVHLDRVDGLGAFVEIEVPFEGGAGPARQTMTRLVRELGIARADVLDRSYADLLANRPARPTEPRP
jgi:predicted adenylyl cyclase CyaB